MGLLDLPIFVLRFPQGIEDEQNALVLEVDATGDVCLTLPNRIETSLKAVEAFCAFWMGSERKKLIKLLQKMFNDWQNPLRLIAQWNNYERRFREEFKADLLQGTTSLKKFFENPFPFLTVRPSLQDVTVLEVMTRLRNSPKPFMVTQIDWKGDFSQTVAPGAIGRDDIFSCHMKGVELALFIKAVLRDFLVRLMKKIAIF